MTRPNRDLDQAGHTLQVILAPNLTNALEHIRRELSVLDGFPERGDSVTVRATAELTSVERAANGRYELGLMYENLRDGKLAVLTAIRELNEMINEAMRMRQPRQVTQPKSKDGLCCSGQKGLDGVHLSEADGGWSDPNCMMPAVKKGMCTAHYFRYYRWCKLHGEDRTSKDFEPA